MLNPHNISPLTSKLDFSCEKNHDVVTILSGHKTQSGPNLTFIMKNHKHRSY